MPASVRYVIGPVTIDGPLLEAGKPFELRLVGFVQNDEPVGGQGVGPGRLVPVDQGRGWAPEGYAGTVRGLRVTDWDGPRPGRAQDAGMLRDALERLEASMESLRALKALRVAVKALEEIASGGDFGSAHPIDQAGEALLAVMRELDGPYPELPG